MKKNHVFFLILTLLYIQSISAQQFTDSKIYKGQKFRTFQMKIDSSSIKKISFNRNSNQFTLENLINKELPASSKFLLTNACINDSTGNPLGLFVSNKLQLNKLNLDTGKGNFFLKPNGILLITKDNVNIIESSTYSKLSNIINATQSGPILILNDTIHKLFNPKSSNKNLRSGVGISTIGNQKSLVFVVSEDPINFYDFATFFKDVFNCKDALCLESANTIFYDSEIEVNPNEKNKVIGNYIKILLGDVDNALNQPTIVRMQLSKTGIYQIPVEVNGVLKISFILDSGASDVSISPDIALTLIKTGTITQSDFIGVQEYVFANGSKATSNVFILKEIKIGDLVIKNVRASISNSINSPMLLGQSVLQQLGKFTIDNKRHILSISK